MLSYRLYFKNKNKLNYVTMYNLFFTDFFLLLDNNINLKKQFNKHMKNDFIKQLNIKPPKSIFELWKNNKTFYNKKMRICILIHKKKYIGSFRYYKSKFSNIFNFKLDNKTYIKIDIVYIIPKYRNLGLAYNMLLKILDNKFNFLLVVDNNNTKAYNLYKKLGFTKKKSNNEITILVKNKLLL